MLDEAEASEDRRRGIQAVVAARPVPRRCRQVETVEDRTRHIGRLLAAIRPPEATQAILACLGLPVRAPPTLAGPSRRRPRGNCRSLGLRARPRRLRARPDPRPPSHRSRPETAASGRAWLPCGGRPSLRGAQAGASAGPLVCPVRSAATRRVRLTRRGLSRAAAGAAALAVLPARSRAMKRALAEVGRDRRGCWRVRCPRYGDR